MATGDKTFLQKQIDESNKLSADFLANGETNVAVSNEEKTTWNGKQDKLTAGVGIGINDYNTIFAKFNTFIAWTSSESGININTGQEVKAAYDEGKACFAMYHTTSTKQGVTKDVYDVLPLTLVEYIGEAGESVYRFNFSGITKAGTIVTCYITSNDAECAWGKASLGVQPSCINGNGTSITGGSHNVINVVAADTTISSTTDGVKVAYGDNAGLETDEYGIKVRVGDGLTTEGAGEIRVRTDNDTMGFDTDWNLKSNYKDYYKSGSGITIAADGTINNTTEYTGNFGINVNNTSKEISLLYGNGLMMDGDYIAAMPGDTMKFNEAGGFDVNSDDDTIISDPDNAYKLKACYKEYYKPGAGINIATDGTISATGSSCTFEDPLINEDGTVKLQYGDGLKVSDSGVLEVLPGDYLTTQSGTVDLLLADESGLANYGSGLQIAYNNANLCINGGELDLVTPAVNYVPGDNISFTDTASGKAISATDTTYYAGYGIDISDDGKISNTQNLMESFYILPESVEGGQELKLLYDAYAFTTHYSESSRPAEEDCFSINYDPDTLDILHDGNTGLSVKNVILTDTATSIKYKLQVTNGVLSVVAVE